MSDRDTIIRGLDYWARNADNPAIRVDCAAARDYILAEKVSTLEAEPVEPTPRCTSETGHRVGADHRWQECPTYHEDAGK
jgi:hypothetical protein